MSDKTPSNRKIRSSNRAKRSLLTYFTTPLIYILVLLIVAIPVGKYALNYAVNVVHEIQQTLTIGFYDYEVDSSEIIAQITCEEKGLECDLYRGISRQHLLVGASLSTEGGNLGETKQNIWGYYNVAFTALKNVEVGDVITISTTADNFNYCVFKVEVSDSLSEEEYDVVFATHQNNGAFSNFGDKIIYVYANLVDGGDLNA